MLESARVEVAVLLNEIAYLKYEAASSSQTSETTKLKQRNVATSFSLVERIIKLIANISSKEGTTYIYIIVFTVQGVNQCSGIYIKKFNRQGVQVCKLDAHTYRLL